MGDGLREGRCNAKTRSHQISPLLSKGQKSFVIVVNGILKESSAEKIQTCNS